MNITNRIENNKSALDCIAEDIFLVINLQTVVTKNCLHCSLLHSWFGLNTYIWYNIQKLYVNDILFYVTDCDSTEENIHEVSETRPPEILKDSLLALIFVICQYSRDMRKSKTEVIYLLMNSKWYNSTKVPGLVYLF